MSATITFLYPNEPHATYDFESYKNAHMPLMQKHWTNYGLKRWSITKFQRNADGSPLPYVFYEFIELESAEQLRAAFADAAGEEMANDVKNYTSVKPIVLMGELWTERSAEDGLGPERGPRYIEGDLWHRKESIHSLATLRAGVSVSS